MRIGTANEGVERFQPMRQAALGQLVERPVDLQRRLDAVAAQLIENVIGRERRFGMRQGAQHQLLIAGQIVGPDVIVSCVRMRHGGAYFPSIAGINSAMLCRNMSR